MREPRSQTAEFQFWDGNRGFKGKLSPLAQSRPSGDATERRGDPESTQGNSSGRDRDPGQGQAVAAAGARPPGLSHSRSRDRSADQGLVAAPAGKCSPRRPVLGAGRVRSHAVASAYLRVYTTRPFLESKGPEK